MNKKFNTIRYSNDFLVNQAEEIRISKVLDLIGKNKTVLDLGCGDGFFMERILKNGNHVVGIEIAGQAILKARNKGFEVYDLSLEGNFSQNIAEKFDCVFAGEIIEHIFNTDNFLQNIKKILKDDGFLVLTTTNISTLGRRIFL